MHCVLPIGEGACVCFVHVMAIMRSCMQLALRARMHACEVDAHLRRRCCCACMAWAHARVLTCCQALRQGRSQGARGGGQHRDQLRRSANREAWSGEHLHTHVMSHGIGQHARN